MGLLSGPSYMIKLLSLVSSQIQCIKVTMQKGLSMYVFSSSTTAYNYGPLGPLVLPPGACSGKMLCHWYFCKFRLCYTSHSKRTTYRSSAAQTTYGPVGQWAHYTLCGPCTGKGFCHWCFCKSRGACRSKLLQKELSIYPFR